MGAGPGPCLSSKEGPMGPASRQVCPCHPPTLPPTHPSRRRLQQLLLEQASQCIGSQVVGLGQQAYTFWYGETGLRIVGACRGGRRQRWLLLVSEKLWAELKRRRWGSVTEGGGGQQRMHDTAICRTCGHHSAACEQCPSRYQQHMPETFNQPLLSHLRCSPGRPGLRNTAACKLPQTPARCPSCTDPGRGQPPPKHPGAVCGSEMPHAQQPPGCGKPSPPVPHVPQAAAPPPC